MPYLGPPNRGSDPLYVWVMVLALIVAAAAGAGLGFAIDLIGGTTEEVVEAPPP